MRVRMDLPTRARALAAPRSCTMNSRNVTLSAALWIGMSGLAITACSDGTETVPGTGGTGASGGTTGGVGGTGGATGGTGGSVGGTGGSTGGAGGATGGTGGTGGATSGTGGTG